ncbi:MAG: glycosyltransferase [Betaproteobacteria bacterium]
MSAPAANPRCLRVLGIRGVPATHGGFETFAEALAPALVDRGWRVVVYCQQDGRGPLRTDHWRGVERVHVPVALPGTAGTMWFDWLSISHVLAEHRRGDAGLCLTLGYNTAAFCARLRAAGVRNLINMDGIEWRRNKWGPLAKAWFWLNEGAGLRLGDHLVADHPEIAAHLGRRAPAARMSTIPYGADVVMPSHDSAMLRALASLGLASGGYATVIARPEPENSILEIVSAWSTRPRGLTLAVLGRYDAADSYHRAVRAAAGPEVRFLGPIFDRPLVQQLRAHARLYLHGHRVGGTNPSLVEALAAGNPVMAHDNAFNRWVAGPGAHYFGDAAALDVLLACWLSTPSAEAAMRAASRARHAEAFTQTSVVERYAELLAAWLPTVAAPIAQRLQGPAGPA